MDTWDKSTPSRGSSRYRGPEEAACLLGVRSSKAWGLWGQNGSKSSGRSWGQPGPAGK